MRIAALYDVHGMPWALEAALRDVAAERVDLIVFGGDLIYGPFPARALGLARSVEARFVRGNCERAPAEWDRAPHGGAARPTLQHWPMSVSVDGVLYCHATPADDLPATTARTQPDVLDARFGGVAEQTIVIGHTHHQFDLQATSVRVVNAGSVGMPHEDDVAAFWTLVEDGEPLFRRSAFDIERAVAEVRASGWPLAETFVAENLLAAPSRNAHITAIEEGGLDMSDRVTIGRVGRSHGLDGSFVVERPSDDPRWWKPGTRFLVGGVETEVVGAKRPGGRVVVKVEPPPERGAPIEVERSALPATDEGEFYVFQLVGLHVEEEGGRALGTVSDVAPGVANDVLELDSGLALPLHEECVRDVDLAAGRILVAPGFSDPD